MATATSRYLQLFMHGHINLYSPREKRTKEKINSTAMISRTVKVCPTFVAIATIAVKDALFSAGFFSTLVHWCTLKLRCGGSNPPGASIPTFDRVVCHINW